MEKQRELDRMEELAWVAKVWGRIEGREIKADEAAEYSDAMDRLCRAILTEEDERIKK